MAAYTSFDWNALLDKLGGDAGFVRGLLAVALRSTRAAPGELREACAAADYERLARLAHKVKGTAGDLVAEPLRLQASDAELAARRHDVSAIGRNLALADALDALLAEIQVASTGTD